MTAIAMITTSTIAAMMESFSTAYGKNGFPWDFRIWYSRRYCSLSRAFTSASDVFLLERLGQLCLQPWRSGGSQLHDQIQVDRDQRGDQDRDQQHVDRIEARQGRGAELRPGAQE